MATRLNYAPQEDKDTELQGYIKKESLKTLDKTDQEWPAGLVIAEEVFVGSERLTDFAL